MLLYWSFDIVNVTFISIVSVIFIAVLIAVVAFFVNIIIVADIVLLFAVIVHVVAFVFVDLVIIVLCSLLLYCFLYLFYFCYNRSLITRAVHHLKQVLLSKATNFLKTSSGEHQDFWFGKQFVTAASAMRLPSSPSKAWIIAISGNTWACVCFSFFIAEAVMAPSLPEIQSIHGHYMLHNL